MLLNILQRLLALVSLALLALAVYGVWSWWRLHEINAGLPPGLHRDPQDWRLWGGLILLALAAFGRLPVAFVLGRRGDDGDRLRRRSGLRLETQDGARLHVEVSGPEGAPAILLVHGWGLEAGMWREARAALEDRYRVIAFDLAGLGLSGQPRDRRYSMDRMAGHVAEVTARLAPDGVVLVGHSIGGMIVQTLLAQGPAARSPVCGAVLANTTHRDPSRATALGPLLYWGKPLLIAAMWGDIWLWPLVWLLNWQSYFSGWTHVAMRIGGFGTRPTQAQLEEVALDATRNHPAVQAKGNLAMLRWAITNSLPGVETPILVLAGGRDLVTRADEGATLARLLPEGRIETVGDAGHLGPMERSDLYDRAVAVFADQCFARRGAGRKARRADASPV